MKYLLHIISLGIVAMLSACGEFFTFEDLELVDSVKMRVAQDTAYVMVGDTMALKVCFDPPRSENMPVFWEMNSFENDSSAVIMNDTITALIAGEVDVIAHGNSGAVSDTCHVVVFDRWIDQSFETLHPSDMVIYADITIGGKPWNTETQIIAAFARGSIIGFAEDKEAYGIRYALLRLWSVADENVGTISFWCYDRSKHMLYQADKRPEFSALSHLGTLSDLYLLNF